MSDKRQKIIIGIVVVAFMILVLGVTYAWFNVNVTGTGSTMQVTTTSLALEYSDGPSLNISNWFPGDSLTKIFTVENTGTDTAYYDIKLEINQNDFVGDDLVYSLTSDNNGAIVPQTVVPSTTGYIATGISIGYQVTQRYEFNFLFKEESINQNSNQNATFVGTILIDSPYAVTASEVAFEGNLYDGEGNPIPSGLIILHSDPQSTTTDTNGYFKFDMVEHGNHTITIKNMSNQTLLDDTLINILPAIETPEIKQNTFAIKENKFDITLNNGELQASIQPALMSLKSKILLDNNGGLSDSSIDFSLASSATNGQGLYYTSDEVVHGEDGQRIHYFRGDVENNWVNYAGYLWRIVRTTAEGGVRLVYSGDGVDNSGGFLPLPEIDDESGSMFAVNDISKYYIGYTHNTLLDGYTSLDKSGQTDSIIKCTVDTWYIGSQATCPNYTVNYSGQGIQEQYRDYLSNTSVYCNDKSVELNDEGLTDVIDDIYYPSLNRVELDSRPTFSCSSGNGSRYTVEANNTNGNNGYLDYPIGLLSADELNYAGVVSYYYDSSTNSYIMDNVQDATWWTSTPKAFYNGGYKDYWTVDPLGELLENSASDSYRIRPAVSLKACIKHIGSGNGTKANPYMITDSEC